LPGAGEPSSIMTMPDSTALDGIIAADEIFPLAVLFVPPPDPLC